MTNSVPKMSNRVERQGSPNTGGKRNYYKSGSSIKSTTYFASGNRNSTKNSNSGRSSCSPPAVVKNLRYSPARNESPRGSPTSSFYAGAKFSEPPSPACLPKPPSHWTTTLMTSCHQQSETYCSFSNHLKMILNVQA